MHLKLKVEYCLWSRAGGLGPLNDRCRRLGWFFCPSVRSAQAGRFTTSDSTFSYNAIIFAVKKHSVLELQNYKPDISIHSRRSLLGKEYPGIVPDCQAHTLPSLELLTYFPLIFGELKILHP